MKNVRIGVIGLGNMGKYHADYLLQNKVNRCELAAVASSNPAKLEKYPALKQFSTGQDLIASGTVDAVLIATPHYSHTTLGIAAFQAGLHVMVEKPISVHKADCERLIAAAQAHPQLVFGAMFQLRTEPRYQKIKQLIEGGELGQLVRLNWIITDWFRTEAYYSSGGWRATWKGEGGGALLNQCPHQLDLLQWLAGMPGCVRGFCQFGRYHNIEVEDNVTLFMEYPNGATAVFITSTGEAPGTNRFEIAGDRGKLVLENGKLTFTRNEASMRDFSKTAKTGFARPSLWHIDIPLENTPAQHATVMQNFVEAILDGAPLIVPGAEGINSVEIANGALYSSWTGQTVELPLDAQAYEKALQQKIAESRFEKKVVQTSDEDFAKSFIR
ncbi:MAG TPA: Gfo/Idh/MocA family oxidoreductase [Verrucomicrobiae bacterium]|nr:Gfo/Idh/MocA family oxidoreductase [Verrucomicrobiae bacterium]